MVDKTVNAADNVSTKSESENVMVTLQKNFHNKKVRYKMYYPILHAVLLVAMLLFLIAIICYHYTKPRSKQKNVDALTI